MKYIVCSKCGYKEEVAHAPYSELVLCPKCKTKHFPKKWVLKK